MSYRVSSTAVECSFAVNCLTTLKKPYYNVTAMNLGEEANAGSAFRESAYSNGRDAGAAQKRFFLVGESGE